MGNEGRPVKNLIKSAFREIVLTVHPEVVRLSMENAKLRAALKDAQEHSNAGWELADALNDEVRRLRKEAK